MCQRKKNEFDTKKSLIVYFWRHVKKKMSFEFSFLCEVQDDLLALRTFYNHHIKKLKEKAESGNYDKLISNIIKESHRLRKFIVNIFWFESEYESELIKSKIYDVVNETIKLIKLNIDIIQNSNINLFYFNLPLIIVKVGNYDDTFFEQSILTKTQNLVKMMSEKYISKIKVESSEEFLNNSINMTINLFKKVQKTKHTDIVSFKTSKNFVKKNSTRLFHDEINTLF